MNMMSISASTAAAALVLGLTAGPLNAADFNVTVSNFSFEPSDLTIQVGDTVTWTNTAGTHNVNAPGFFRCANGCDGQPGGDGNPSGLAWSFSMTADTPATINYFCDPHAALGMTGRLTILGSSALTLSIDGACPGPTDVQLAGGTPSGTAALVYSGTMGTTVVPAGRPCAGTVLNIAGAQLFSTLPLDPSGAAGLSPTIPTAGCGVLVQALDVATCTVSNVATVPGGAATRGQPVTLNWE